MKRIIGIGIITVGILLALGPQFLFKVCDTDPNIMRCHWTAQAEIGIGGIIALLGIAMFIFADIKIRLGLSIGILLSGICALLVPHVLIGGCSTASMACNTTAFPAITVISILLLAGVLINIIHSLRKLSPTLKNTLGLSNVS